MCALIRPRAEGKARSPIEDHLELFDDKNVPLLRGTVARVGGDEFVVLMEGITSAESVQTVAAKILVELSRPVVIGTAIAQAGVSIGIAIYPIAGRTSEDLLRAADGAMYEAKAAGRNCYR